MLSLRLDRENDFRSLPRICVVFVRSATGIARRGRRERGSWRNGAEGTRPHSVPDEVWAEVVRRRAAVALLAGKGPAYLCLGARHSREPDLRVTSACRLIAFRHGVPCHRLTFQRVSFRVRSRTQSQAR